MSKSIGNVTCPFSLIETFGPHSVRTYFLSEGPLLKDANFDEANVKELHNGFICDQYVNLLNRVRGKKVMKCMPTSFVYRADQTTKDEFSELVDQVELLASQAVTEMENLDFPKAFAKIQHLIHLGNANLSTREFWLLAKSKEENDLRLLENLLYLTFEISRIASLLL